MLAEEAPLTRKPRAVVVGASTGIGAAVAQRLAAEGYVVVLLARRKDLLDELCRQINTETGENVAFAYQHDVTETHTTPGLFQQLLKDLGGLDLIVYNAGAMPKLALTEFDWEKDRQTLETNLLGAVAWLGPAAALFQAMGAGSIVGLSSVAGDRGRVANPAYNSSKSGLDAYLEGLRNRLTRHGVHVLTVKPGFVDTEMLKAARATFGKISPEQAALGIWKAIRRRNQLVYLPWWWRWVMLVVRLVPSFIFRRLSF
jgi:short-subunit dehydrogenase